MPRRAVMPGDIRQHEPGAKVACRPCERVRVFDTSRVGDDHIDRHRSFVMAISPFARRGYAGKDHTSIMSITRSIWTGWCKSW